jgi:hypothetical protein
MFPEFEKQFLELLKEATKDDMEEVVKKLGEINESNERELKINLDKIFEKNLE